MNRLRQPRSNMTKTIQAVVSIALVLSGYSVHGQTLSLDDIFHVRTLDSAALILFAQEKGFELKEVEIDAWRSVHRYYATDRSASFQRTFPTGRKVILPWNDNTKSKDTKARDNGMVYYNFKGQSVLEEFRKKLKENRFRFKRTDEKDFGGTKYTHNIHVSKDMEIDLASEEIPAQEVKYTLMYYRRMN